MFVRLAEELDDLGRGTFMEPSLELFIDLITITRLLFDLRGVVDVSEDVLKDFCAVALHVCWQCQSRLLLGLDDLFRCLV